MLNFVKFYPAISRISRSLILSSPILPTTAQRRHRSETDKNILQDLSSSVLSHCEKYHPSGNLKFNYLGIFQSLKLHILLEKFL